MAFGQSERKIRGRRKVPKSEGRSRTIKKYASVMRGVYMDTCHYKMRKKDHRFHYNDWLLKLKKVIYLIYYNSCIDIPFLNLTAVFPR